MKKAKRKQRRMRVLCMGCDGCGWCEGSPAFTCHECKGVGSVLISAQRPSASQRRRP